jgi:hypothetical protein
MHNLTFANCQCPSARHPLAHSPHALRYLKPNNAITGVDYAILEEVDLVRLFCHSIGRLMFRTLILFLNCRASQRLLGLILSVCPKSS